MQASLELSGHPKANVQRVILSNTTLVGRSRECGLQIASASVSRKHCEIRMNGESVSVIDLGSSNGTYIDSDRLPAGEERVLHPGCRLNVGGVRFIVQYESSDAAAEPDGLPDVATAGVASVTAEVSAEAESLDVDESVVAEDPILAEDSHVSDQPILLSADPSADEPSLSDEATLPDEVPLAEDVLLSEDEAVTEDAVIADNVEATVAGNATTAADSPESDEELFDPLAEPDVMDLFDDESGTGVSEVADDSSRNEIPEEEGSGEAEDEPILEADEDQAFAFLTDEEDDTPADARKNTEDSRLGDFLGQLGRD